MKKLLFVLFLFFLSWSYAQDTLYLRVPGLGHEKYVLKDKANFIYSSSLCGFHFVSFGSYKKNIFGFRFVYDTSLCPNPFILAMHDEQIHDKTTLFFHNMVDSTLQPRYHSFLFGGWQYECNSDSILIPKSKLKSDELILTDISNSLVFKFDTTASTLHVYLPPSAMGYRCGIKNVRKLKKTKLGYLHKFHVYDENRDKPWKKGTKRIVRHYYQLRQRQDKHNFN